MTLLIWLAASSLLWGGLLWIAGRALQRSTNVMGSVRQWIWRGATALLLAPWIAAPFVVLFKLGLAPAETVATITLAGSPAAGMIVGLPAFDTAGVQTAVVANGGGVLAWLGQASLPELLVAVFVAGWIVRFVLAQLALRSLLGIVNVSREAGPGIAQSFVQSWAKRLKLRPAPRLRIVAEQHSPFSYGILRPTICVPEGMEEMLSRGSLDLVVGHESLHIARGDGWLRPVERVTADILWFNPFAWLIRRELDVARELAVDEAVLAMSNARIAYARTLRDVAGFAAGLPNTAPAASMSLPGGRNLMMRVSRTLGHAGRKPARAAITAACLLGMIAAPIAIAQVMMAVPAPPPPLPPAFVEPVEPVAPVPPIDQMRLYVAPDGVVRTSFAGKITSTGGNATKGFTITLISTDRTDEGDICVAEASGLSELSVATGEGVVRAQPIGRHRNGIGFTVRVECSDKIDAANPTKLSDAPPPPSPPPPPEPPEPVDAVAPLAPVAPVTAPKGLRAPVAPLAPLPPLQTEALAPLAPMAPPSPAAYAPLAPPPYARPVPMVAPTPPTRVTPITPTVAPTPPTPVTPMTPMVAPPAPPSPVAYPQPASAPTPALDGAGSDGL